MGGLFSGPQQPQQQNRTPSFTQSASDPTSAHYQQYEALRRRLLLEEQRKFEERKREEQRKFEERKREEQRKFEERKRVEQQYLIPISSRPLHKAVLQHPLAVDWDPMPSNSAFIRANVQQYTQEYNTVLHMFKKTTQKQFNIVKIERIQNPYLLGCYQLKKNEMECLHGNYVEEGRFFHGTKQNNVHSICENNFNWRLHGESTGNRYGKGVSFSNISYYASHYSDKHAPVKVMFLVRVLISKCIIGDGNMTIPPLIINVHNYNSTERYDTAKKENGQVIVKFCDNEYYPEYLIHYTGTPCVKKNARNYTYVYDDY